MSEQGSDFGYKPNLCCNLPWLSQLTLQSATLQRDGDDWSISSLLCRVSNQKEHRPFHWVATADHLCLAVRPGPTHPGMRI